MPKPTTREMVSTAARHAVSAWLQSHLGVVAAVALGVVTLVVLLGMVLLVAVVASRPPPVADTADSDIPPVAVAAYLAASQAAADLVEGCVVRPAVIAAIGRIESGHGTFGGAAAAPDGTVAPRIIGVALDGAGPVAAIADTDDGVMDGDTVWDRAVGPMQFIPSSWSIFGKDLSGDGQADPHNLFDAAAAAVVHLCGANPTDLDADPEALRAAIYSYNHSDVYVSEVLGYVATYDVVFGASSGRPVRLGEGSPLALLANPGYSGASWADDDLTGGLVDARAIAVTSMLADHHPLYVVGFQTGHYQCIGGGSRRDRPSCTESHHWYGRGVDISSVNGQPVTASNTAARELVELLAETQWPDPSMRPNVGSPWPDFDGLPGFFHDADHRDHIHMGFCGPRWTGGRWEPDGC